ncbi:hypothetical protein PGT21_033988 [Puccinia graminis f. sp. tritici]|uniref:Uncharacterized protein n=1 Tax=Puccinia graminis f. sp. tritici TaxID=56615 RepID=A0A5B0N5Z1_PUCGR|nr:hypothetical protein PGT21_033988 [Puccinia graminis f. sp. tritici]
MFVWCVHVIYSRSHQAAPISYCSIEIVASDESLERRSQYEFVRNTPPISQAKGYKSQALLADLWIPQPTPAPEAHLAVDRPPNHINTPLVTNTLTKGYKMQARKTLFSFVLVVSALAGLASAAPSSSTADAAAAAPPTQEKAGSPAAAASAASADKQAAAGQEGASTASQANPQNAAVFAATGTAEAPTPGATDGDTSGKAGHKKRNADAAPAGKIPDSADKADSATQANPQNAAVFAATGAADATTAATTGEDASGKADHKKRNADAAPTGKIPDSTDKADSTTQANPQNAAVFSAASPTDASTVSTAGDEASSKTGHAKRNADAAPTGKIPDSADKADSAAQGVPQFNAVDAAANGQATDAAFASTHAVAQTRRSEPSGAAADGKKDATAENTSQPSPKDSQTPQEAQQLNASPSGSTPDSGAENPASDKKDHWCVFLFHFPFGEYHHVFLSSSPGLRG